MIKRTLAQIAHMLNIPVSPAMNEIHVAGVSTDSRTIRSGQLFVPIIGEHFNGHSYVVESMERGASAALWQKGEPNPPSEYPLLFVDDVLESLKKLASAYLQQVNPKVVAVTGSNGKTTTKDLIHSILATTFRTIKTEGNLNNHIGLPLTVLQMEDDTEIAVLEMGMSGFGEISSLSQLARPEVAVITNIGEAHLLQLGTRHNIAKAKLEILDGLTPGGVFIYPGEEPLIETLLAECTESAFERFRFGFGEENDLYPIAMMQDDLVTHFQLNEPIDTQLTIPLLGRHNIMNAMAAIAVGMKMGVPTEEIVRGLQEVELSGMRMEWLNTRTGMTILNDAYNSSPTAMRAVLELVGQLNQYNRKALVIGDMLELGPDEINYHREIGREIDPKKIDYVFTFGKMAENIAEEAKVNFPPGRVQSFRRRSDLVRRVLSVLTSEDLVVVKGSRGMKLDIVVKHLLNS